MRIARQGPIQKRCLRAKQHDRGNGRQRCELGRSAVVRDQQVGAMKEREQLTHGSGMTSEIAAQAAPALAAIAGKVPCRRAATASFSPGWNSSCGVPSGIGAIGSLHKGTLVDSSADTMLRNCREICRYGL